MYLGSDQTQKLYCFSSVDHFFAINRNMFKPVWQAYEYFEWETINAKSNKNVEWGLSNQDYGKLLGWLGFLKREENAEDWILLGVQMRKQYKDSLSCCACLQPQATEVGV